MADIYQSVGFAEYSKRLAPRLLDLAFDLKWTGRSLLDLGCGTGDLAHWFAGRQFSTRGLDSSSAMVARAESVAVSAQLDAHFEAGDIRHWQPTTPFEMVTCVGGTLNYLTSLRDLEAAFKTAQAALAPRKLFFFDLRTIKDLAETPAEEILVDSDAITILTHNSFNYDALTLTTRYSIFRLEGGGVWRRYQENHTQRGYPIQPIARMLQQAGFRLVRMMTPDMQPVETVNDEKMLVFVAVRDGTGTLG
jgi:SAM-dependent methyltransferase